MRIVRGLAVPAIIVGLFLALAALLAGGVWFVSRPPSYGCGVDSCWGRGILAALLAVAGIVVVVVGLVTALIRWLVKIRRSDVHIPRMSQALQAAGFGAIVAIISCPFIMCGLVQLLKAV